MVHDSDCSTYLNQCCDYFRFPCKCVYTIDGYCNVLQCFHCTIVNGLASPMYMYSVHVHVYVMCVCVAYYTCVYGYACLHVSSSPPLSLSLSLSLSFLHLPFSLCMPSSLSSFLCFFLSPFPFLLSFLLYLSFPSYHKAPTGTRPQITCRCASSLW